MKRSSNTDGDNSIPDKKAKIRQSGTCQSSSSLDTESSASSSSSSSSLLSFSQSSASSSSNTSQETAGSSKRDDGSNFESSPLVPDGGHVLSMADFSAEELASYTSQPHYTIHIHKKWDKITEEAKKLKELKSVELQKLNLLFVNRPYKPYSSDEIFYNALQLTNLVVGVRRNCKYRKLRFSPPYSYLEDTTDPLNYIATRNEVLAHCVFKNLVDYQVVRNQTNGKKRLQREVALRGEFVQTDSKKAWECGYCKQPIDSNLFTARWDPSATTFPYWTRCEQEETNLCLTNSYLNSRSSGTEKEVTGIMLSEKKWCKTCVEKECQRVVGTDEDELSKRTDEHASLRKAFPYIFSDLVINNVPTMSAISFFPKMMEIVGDIIDPYSLTQELYKTDVIHEKRVKMVEEYRHSSSSSNKESK